MNNVAIIINNLSPASVFIRTYICQKLVPYKKFLLYMISYNYNSLSFMHNLVHDNIYII